MKQRNNNYDSQPKQKVEACPPGGTPLRRKLSARFSDAMNDFVRASGDEMAFFKGRQWITRGVRYPEENDRTTTESGEAALTAAVIDVELAFHESRLRSAVDKAVYTVLQSATTDGGGGGGGGRNDNSKEERAMAVAGLQSTVPGEVIAAVDTLCALAGSVGGGERQIDADDAAARDALEALVGFAGSGEGPVGARRAAVAFLGEVGDAAGDAGLEAVAAVFRGDKSPGVRRTAGDALRCASEDGGVHLILKHWGFGGFFLLTILGRPGVFLLQILCSSICYTWSFVCFLLDLGMRWT